MNIDKSVTIHVSTVGDHNAYGSIINSTSSDSSVTMSASFSVSSSNGDSESYGIMFSMQALGTLTVDGNFYITSTLYRA
jgi:PDZ domain-containing secreted protein